MHQRARTDPSGGRGATRVPTGTQGNAELVAFIVGWLYRKEEWMALLGRQTTGRSSLGNCHNFLGTTGENSRQSRCVVPSRDDDELAVGAERRATHSALEKAS